MIEYLWGLVLEVLSFVQTNVDPVRDSIDVLLVTFGIYWLLVLIRGTRAGQVLVGLLVLIAASLAAELFQLATLGMITQNFLGYAVLIVIVLFHPEIRRALARVGRGFFPQVTKQEESQILESVVRAAQTLAQKRVGALIVLERETGLEDQVEAGQSLDAVVSRELLTAIFLPYSPLHDGAVVIQGGRIHQAGCILPLTLRTDLPEDVGTRHRAAVGITEETDAVVIVVSEETATISVVMGGEMMRGLDAPRLRVVLRDILAGERRELATPPEAPELPRPVEAGEGVPGGAEPVGAARDRAQQAG